MISRRELLKGFGGFALGAVTGDFLIETSALSRYRERHKEVSIYLDPILDIFYEYRDFSFQEVQTPHPFHLVFLSDVHLSATNEAHLDIDGLSRVVQTINALMRNLDSQDWIFVLGGDLVNHSSSRFSKKDYPQTPRSIWEKGIEMLSEIDSTKKFAVLGNHERDHTDVDLIAGKLSSCGLARLDDQSEPYQHNGVEIFGLPDFTTVRYSQGALSALKLATSTTKPKLVISHNPELFEHLVPENALSLAGHLHGGHLAQVGLSQRYASRLALEVGLGYHGKFVEGLYRLPNQSSLLINNGIGDHPLNLGTLRTSARTVQIVRVG